MLPNEHQAQAETSVCPLWMQSKHLAITVSRLLQLSLRSQEVGEVETGLCVSRLQPYCLP